MRLRILLVSKLGSIAFLLLVLFAICIIIILFCRNRLYLQILTHKVEIKAQSKIGSLENAGHKPRGGDKKIETVKLDFKERSRSKVGSKEYITHVPGGGDVKVSEKDCWVRNPI